MNTLTSLEHPLVKHWVRLKNDSRYRKKEKRLLLEGKTCIADVAKKYPIKRLISTNKGTNIQADEYFFVTQAIYKKISGVEERNGILAELDLPQMPIKRPITHLLVSDRIQDPGNLGTLIRSACALGWDAIFLIEGSVDPYNDKALRAAKGATFSIPILSGRWDALDELCKKQSLTLIVADLTGTPLHTFKHTDSVALVLGNEGQGVAIPEGVEHKKVHIAIKKETESLNVAQAGAIFLYELKGSR